VTPTVQDRNTALAIPETPEQSGAAFLTIIAAAARDPNVDIAKMESLLRMQADIQAKQAEMAFHQAMTRLQPRLPRITKNGRIEFGTGAKAQSTPYARYEDIDAVIRPLLREEGFSKSFGTSPLEKGGILISMKLSHIQGHSEVTSMPLPFDTSGSKNSIQAVGSTLQYGKRYLTCAAFDLITENEDDDGSAISFIDDRQHGILSDMIAACEMDAGSQSKFLEFMSAKSLSEIYKKDYEKAITALRVKLRKRQERS
jgi:hypothetical protein